jgi:hypothetical protein
MPTLNMTDFFHAARLPSRVSSNFKSIKVIRDMQEILNKYCKPNNHGLLLLSMPTGFGKTYNVLKFIYDNYHEFADQKRKIIFITNLKKNLPIQELRERFIQDGKEESFAKNVLFIDSNSENVINKLLTLDDEITDDFQNTENYKSLKKCIEICDNKQLPKDVKDSFANQIRKELEPAFRKIIQARLKEKFKTKEERLEAIKNNPDYQWIGKLYPAVFTDEKTVLFLSIDKFILKNTTLIEPSYYFHERLINNALIFIDEFDTTKESVLNNIIESGLQNKVDLLDLFLNIHNHLIPSEDPESLIKESQWWQKKKASGKNWLSPQEQIQSFREKANEIFKEYQLQHTCKSHPDFSTQKRNFLFYDYKFHNVIDRKKLIEIIQESIKRTNWINSVDINAEKTGVDIRSLLGEIAGFLTYFQRGISHLAENYRYLKDEDDKIKELFNLEFAVKSVLNHFRLDSADVQFLANNIMAGNLLYKFSLEKEINKLQSFYDRGFRYYDIVDSNEHDTLSKIYMFNFNRTPESFLAEVCSKAMVVGISATAGLYTNIGNYDIKYLNSRLGDSFIHLKEDEILNLKNDYYQGTQGYEKVTIKPKFIGTDSQKEAIKQLKELLNDEDAAKNLWDTLRYQMSDDNDKKIEFVFCRYVRALTAWKYFLENPDCHCFICFFNKLPKRNDPTFDLDRLFEYAKLLIYDNKDVIDDSISDTIVVLDGDNFDEKKDRLLNDLKNNKRRFIISTYQTIGVGQNLQFEIPSSIKPIHINSLTENKSMDINGIYLDKPTNLLVNILNSPIKDNDFIKYIFQLEFLRENGAIAQNIFKSKLDEAFKRYVGMDKYQKKASDFVSLYDTAPYSRFLNKVIIQAIGRICRTNMKSPKIHILADDSIRKHLINFSLPEDVIPVREYSALLELAGESTNKSQDLIEAQNNAAKISNRTYDYIRSQLNTPWKNESVKAWQDLREQVLRQPAIAKESECNRKWQNIYVKLPKPANSYYFSQENDYQEIEVFFSDKDEKKQKVSEKTARLSELMKIGMLQKLFRESGWATEFSESELMLTPPMFNNIYKGALGEVCGKHILERELDIPLLELEVKEFERFDFKTAQNIYIDFKLWNDKVAVEAEPEIDKIRNKMKEVGAEKVFIINILGSVDTQFYPTISSDRKIVQVPYLCKNDKVDNEAIKFIREEF